MLDNPDPCDECGQRPAVIDGLCGACWTLAHPAPDYDDFWEYEVDEDFDESDWYNERTREPR